VFIAVEEIAMNHVLTRLAALLVLQGTALSFGVGTLAASTAQAQALADGIGTTVDALKDSVVARLATCETQGKADPDALIVRDANGELSMGRLQFQTRTVIAYTKETEARLIIDSSEARRIALDGERSAKLAKRIIFEKDGVGHWHHCARKLGLYQEVNAIRQMR
jgi:ABC-type hemin transport system substrate-binding protein